MTSRVFGFRAPVKGLVRVGAALMAGLLVACASAAPPIPEPRPIVNTAGARLRMDHERAQKVNDWLTLQQTNMQEDPSFWVITEATTDEIYPWEQVEFGKDTVIVHAYGAAPDSRFVNDVYGHLQLMVRMGRQEEWLPEAPDATGYALERAILARASDVWLLGRTVWDTAPYAPLDELIYATEAGYLDAFVFTARPDEFAEARAAWARENPNQAQEYRDWFVQTFNRDPPGLR